MISTITYPDKSIRDLVLASPMERGVNESYYRLKNYWRKNVNWTLEVVVVPVSDVGRAKEFYESKMGFHVDHDTKVSEGVRFVQLTPPGSGCSVVISGPGMAQMEPGSLKGVQLVVNDVRRAQKELASRGVEIGEVMFVGPGGFRPATDEDDLNNNGFAFFSDPDGNGWAVQQITSRP